MSEEVVNVEVKVRGTSALVLQNDALIKEEREVVRTKPMVAARKIGDVEAAKHLSLRETDGCVMVPTGEFYKCLYKSAREHTQSPWEYFPSILRESVTIDEEYLELHDDHDNLILVPSVDPLPQAVPFSVNRNPLRNPVFLPEFHRWRLNLELKINVSVWEDLALLNRIIVRAGEIGIGWRPRANTTGCFSILSFRKA